VAVKHQSSSSYIQTIAVMWSTHYHEFPSAEQRLRLRDILSIYILKSPLDGYVFFSSARDLLEEILVVYGF